MKASSLCRVVRALEEAPLTPQLALEEAPRRALAAQLVAYVRDVGKTSMFNVALPFKLLTALAEKEDAALAAYEAMFMESYSREFLSYYVLSFLSLFVWRGDLM